MSYAWALGPQPQPLPPPPLHLLPPDSRRLRCWAQLLPRGGACPLPRSSPPRWLPARGRWGSCRRGRPASACCRPRRSGRGMLCASAPSPSHQRPCCPLQVVYSRHHRGCGGRGICSTWRRGQSMGTLRAPCTTSHLVCPACQRHRRAPAPARARRRLPCPRVHLQNRCRRRARHRHRRARRRRCVPAPRTAPAATGRRRHRRAAVPGTAAIRRPRHPPRGRWASLPASAGTAFARNGAPTAAATPRPPAGWPEPRRARGAGACARPAPRSAEP
jgi:hypothetical protein